MGFALSHGRGRRRWGVVPFLEYGDTHIAASIRPLPVAMPLLRSCALGVNAIVFSVMVLVWF